MGGEGPSEERSWRREPHALRQEDRRGLVRHGRSLRGSRFLTGGSPRIRGVRRMPTERNGRGDGARGSWNFRQMNLETCFHGATGTETVGMRVASQRRGTHSTQDSGTGRKPLETGALEPTREDAGLRTEAERHTQGGVGALSALSATCRLLTGPPSHTHLCEPIWPSPWSASPACHCSLH